MSSSLPSFTLDELHLQVRSLRRSIRSGALTVTHGDKTVKYRTVGEMQSALTDVLNDIADQEGRRTRRIRYSTVSKGLGGPCKW